MPPPADSTGQLALTFILPTRNRRDFVVRAVESCLQVERPDVRVELLIVDGNSTDGSFEELQRRYGNDPRVRLMRQHGPKGFMPACFLAVPEVRTPFVTFMYDDDVLSPFWGDMPREMRRRSADFVMGFSVEHELGSTASFERVTRLRLVSPSFLIRAFFGCGHELSRHNLPYSPICCLTRACHLREWVRELEIFTRGRPVRGHFMLQRNAGPDLMIYLYSIDCSSGEIVLFDGAVAQFSAHAASITSGLESTDLTIGYWLAHVWLCERLCRLHRIADAGWCSAYTVKQGIRLILRRLRRRRIAWLGSLLREIIALAARALTGPVVVAFVKSFLILLLPRRRRPQIGLPMRIESLLT